MTPPHGRTLPEPDTVGELPGTPLGSRPRALLRVENLAQYYPIRQGLLGRVAFVHAVDGVSLYVRRGETLGLIGESGCGKSTLGRALLRLVEPTYGRVVFDGKNVLAAGANEMRALRAKMQMIFQDSAGSLNPSLTVGRILAESRLVHSPEPRRDETIAELLMSLGLRPKVVDAYPAALSAGERQRVGIARALLTNPDLIVCDEPVSLLDMATRGRVIDWLRVLQDKKRLSLLLISHDLQIIETMSHRVAVMYLGRIVETARTVDLLTRRYHPYTRALVSAAPVAEPGHRRLRMIAEGETPNPLAPPQGCAFHPRCPRARKGTCDRETPMLEEIGQGTQHLTACFFPET